MEYNDEMLPTMKNFEEMARAYNFSLKQKGFVFISLEEEGKNLLVDEVFDLLFRLRASYRFLGSFLDSNIMLNITEEHLLKLRELFMVENNKGYFIRTNQTKCFLNSIALENTLCIKLLLLAQKCEFGQEILSLIIEREKLISNNLTVENTIYSNRN